MPSAATGERTASSGSAVAKGAGGKKKAGKSGGAATIKSKPKVKKAAENAAGGKHQKPPPSTPPRPPVGAAAEAEATPAPAARPSDVVQGMRVRVFFGPQAGWCAGVVQQPYNRSMGHRMDDFEEAPDWPSSTDAAWVIEFDDGDVLCLSLSETRRGKGPTDGNWYPEKSRRITPTGTFTALHSTHDARGPQAPRSQHSLHSLTRPPRRRGIMAYKQSEREKIRQSERQHGFNQAFGSMHFASMPSTGERRMPMRATRMPPTPVPMQTDAGASSSSHHGAPPSAPSNSRTQLQADMERLAAENDDLRRAASQAPTPQTTTNYTNQPTNNTNGAQEADDAAETASYLHGDDEPAMDGGEQPEPDPFTDYPGIVLNLQSQLADARCQIHKLERELASARRMRRAEQELKMMGGKYWHR